jgi:hypothetical protein
MTNVLVAPSATDAKFLRKDGAQNVYSLVLRPGQAVLAQAAGSKPDAGGVKVAAVPWPKLDGVDVENYWGKHKRTSFPPMPPPPPSPPPPPPVTCASVVPPDGYDCFEHRCAFDGDPVKANCGNDICHPSAMGDSRVAALCSVVPTTHANASDIAAARCNAFEGCRSFASCPQYPASHCTASALGGETSSSYSEVGSDSGGDCFKFFTSGQRNFTVAAGWTMWTKKGA